jgi:hypothetical protein
MYFHTVQTSTTFSKSKIVYHQWSEMEIILCAPVSNVISCSNTNGSCINSWDMQMRACSYIYYSLKAKCGVFPPSSLVIMCNTIMACKRSL